MVESKDRKANAHLILKLMCDSVVLRPHLRELLSAKYDSSFQRIQILLLFAYLLVRASEVLTCGHV